MIPRRSAVTAAIALLLLAGAGSAQCAGKIEPPPVVLRDVSKTPRTAKGTTVSLETSVTLFLPEGWRDEITTDGRLRVTVHFHGAQWFVIEEHARRGARNPLIAAYYGEGSTVYRKPFEQPGYFDAMLTSATAELRKRGAPANTRLDPIELQSFSAGYGAVREILKSPEYVSRIDRVLLADSLYGNRTTDTLGRPQADPEQLKPFTDYARMAAKGDKVFLFAHTSIVTPYASTVETADGLIKALGAKRELVTTGSLAAAAEGSSFPLTSRCDVNGFHIWGYEGPTGQAHMAVARTIADYWRALGVDRPKR